MNPLARLGISLLTLATFTAARAQAPASAKAKAASSGGVHGKFPGCDLQVTSFQTCDANRNPVAPKLGDPAYFVIATWNVVGNANPYNVTISIGDLSYTWQNIDATAPGQYWACAGFNMPLDGPIPATVALDPGNTSGDTNRSNNNASLTFTPTPPSVPVEYYAPQKMQAYQTMEVDVPANSGIDTMQVVFGNPTTETFQHVDVNAGIPFFQEGFAAPFNYPYQIETIQNPQARSYYFDHQMEVTQSNVMDNLASSMSSWSVYADLPGQISLYLNPEALIQCNDALVAAFVNNTLPANYRQTMTPFQASRALFMAVAKAMTYQYPPPAGDAVTGLTTLLGDCGTMSAVYSATMRHIGIPIRMVEGWLEGQDVWHGWTEMYVPNVGWIPQDVTFSNAVSRSGLFPYYWAIVPDLNQRIVVSRCGTYEIGGPTFVTLQTGDLWLWGDNLIIPNWSVHCSLTPRDH